MKRTSMNLDRELVDRAAGLLGTTRAVDTVHAALWEVVEIKRRQELIDRDWGITPEDLAEMRRGRQDFLEKLARGEDPYRESS